MFTANGNWSRRGNERSRLSALIRYVLSAACLMAFLASARASDAQVPTYEVYATPKAVIKFGVESSTGFRLKVCFEKWDANIKFLSSDVRSAVLVQVLRLKPTASTPEAI